MVRGKAFEPGKWFSEFDEEGNIINMVYDESFQRLLGFDSKEEFEKTQPHWKERIHPDDRKRVLEYNTNNARKHLDGKDYDIELRMLTKNGYRWFHEFGHCIRRPDGSLQRCYGVAFDIEEAKQRTIQLAHEKLRTDILNHLISYEDDPVELIKSFAGRIRKLLDCDQIIYRDLEETRIISNSQAVEKTWSVPIEYCRQCEHFDAHHSIYKDGVVEMTNCQEGFKGIPVYKDCPIKSSLTRLVYCDDEIAGYLAIHYIHKYHEFTDTERDTLGEFTRIISLSLSRYKAKKENWELKLQKEIEEKERQLQEKTQEVDNFVTNFSKDYNLVFSVNISKDTYKILKADKEFTVENAPFKSFSEVIDFIAGTIVYGPDREKIRRSLDYNVIRDRMKRSKTYTIEYRVFAEDKPIWNETTVSKLGRNHYIFGFAARNREILLRHLQEKEYSDYAALLSVDIDDETAIVLKNAEIFRVDIGEVPRPYRLFMENFAHWHSDEAEEFFMHISNLDNLKKELASEEKITFSYQSALTEDRWVTVTIYVLARNDNGQPAVVTIGFSVMDTLGADRAELQNRIQEQNTIMNYFFEQYISGYYIGLDDLSCRVYKRTDDMAEKYPIGSSYLDSMEAFIYNEVHPEDREELQKLIQPKRLKELLHDRPEIYHSFRQITNGNERLIRLVIIRGADESHAALGFRDVTDEERMQQENRKQMQEALSNAQSANNAKSTFLFNMSHDIRTPMNAILGYTDLAIRHFDDTDKTRDCLKKIRASGEHLLSLINDILEMSRIESGRLELSQDPIDIRDIIAEVEYMSEALVISKSIDFEVVIGDLKNPYIYADELHINEVFINIISNAMKYSHEDGKVKFIIEQIGDAVNDRALYRFKVRDNGIGMSEEFQKHLFETFAREKSTTVSRTEGAGIGLSIVKRIVDLAGGTIDIQSKLDVGTTVTIDIPFNVMSDIAIIVYEKERDLSHDNYVEETDLTGKRVLLVEDNEMNREIAEEILKEYGLVVETAINGKEAVNIVTEKGCSYYDCILMDIQMPVMNGYEATKEIRMLPDGMDVPIIAVSANAFDEDKQKSIDAGMNAHIAKPIDNKELFSTISGFTK